LLKPEELELPLHLPDFCSRVLEIGFGNGEYMAFEAKNSPDTLFLGIEVSRSCVVRAVKRTLILDNIRIISGDARFLMRELFRDESFDRVHMNFPCPWPKERHSKRRVTSPEFADSLAAVLKICGYFELMTDDEVYAESARDILSGHGSLECMSYERDPDRPFKTKYERKWLEMGRGVWRVRIRKKSPFTTERIINKTTAIGQEDQAPRRAGCPRAAGSGPANGGVRDQMHFKLEDADFDKINAGKLDSLFDEGGSSGGDVHWVFKKHFYSGSGSEDVRLIETVSSDAGFEQKYYLKVVLRDENGKNTVLVKIDGNSSVYLTPSVRLALSDLADRLKA
jgi:tRNA (guanine-N7-)-methyltransferase